MGRRSLTADSIDFSPEASTPVISGAQKFVLPIAAFKDGGDALVYPDGDKAGQPITDQRGRPIAGRGLVFFNADDGAYQVVRGDGNGVVIIGSVTEAQAAKLVAKVRELAADPSELSLAEVRQVLRYASQDLGLIGMYNSSRAFVASEMTEVGPSTGIPAYGLHRRDERTICRAVYVAGSGEFQGPAATPQKFVDGAVILNQGGDVRLIQPRAFEASYKHADGRPVKVSELAVLKP
jgi:hypothetical protein